MVRMSHVAKTGGVGAAHGWSWSYPVRAPPRLTTSRCPRYRDREGCRRMPRALPPRPPIGAALRVMIAMYFIRAVIRVARHERRMAPPEPRGRMARRRPFRSRYLPGDRDAVHQRVRRGALDARSSNASLCAMIAPAASSFIIPLTRPVCSRLTARRFHRTPCCRALTLDHTTR